MIPPAIHPKCNRAYATAREFRYYGPDGDTANLHTMIVN